MTLLIVAAGAFVASCVQATSGLGFALILTPVLFALISPVGAIITATGLGIVLNVLVLFLPVGQIGPPDPDLLRERGTLG